MDNLDRLFVKNAELNRDVLFELLKDRVRITESGDVIITGKFNPFQKIILYCLSKKVLLIKNLATEEMSGPAEISGKIGLKSGTAKVYVRKLEDDGILINKGGKYFIPNFVLHNLKEKFTDG
jgi:hypothetical protein